MPQLQSNARAASSGARRGQKATSNIGQMPLARSMGKTQEAPSTRKRLPSLASMGNIIPSYAMYLADPLNAPVVGKPDENSVPTVTSRFRDVYVITSNASGEAAVCFYNCTDSFSAFVSPAITAGALTGYGTGTASGYNASILADAVYTRMLAMVVEWQPTGSVNTASGRVFMGQYNGAPPIQALSAYFDDEGMAAPANESACAVTRPTGSLPFGTPGGNAGLNQPSQVIVWTGLAPSTQVGQIVVTRAVEYEPSGVTLAKGYAEHTPCDMYDCCCAANLVGRKVTVASGTNGYKSIVSAGIAVIKAAASMYMGYSPVTVGSLVKLITR